MSSGTAYNFIQHFFCLLVCDSQLTIFILFIIHLDYPPKLSAWCCFFAFSALVFAQSIERVNQSGRSRVRFTGRTNTQGLKLSEKLETLRYPGIGVQVRVVYPYT